MELSKKERDLIFRLDTKGPDEPSVCNIVKNKLGEEYVSTLSWKKNGVFVARPNNAPNNIVYNDKGQILSQSWCESNGGNGLYDEYMHNTYGAGCIFTIEINGEMKERYFYYLKGVNQNEKIEKFIKENNIDSNYVTGKELERDILELYLLNYGS